MCYDIELRRGIDKFSLLCSYHSLGCLAEV